MSPETPADLEQYPPEDSLEAIIYNDDGVLRTSFMQAVVQALENSDTERLKAIISPLHESELGDILEALYPELRAKLVSLAGDEFDFTSLTEVDEVVRLEIINALPNAQIADAVQDIDSDDAVYILEDMEEADQEEILSQLPTEEQVLLRRALEYPEETAGRRMQTEYVAVPAFWTVGQTIDHLRDDVDLPDRFHEVFVVSPTHQLQGEIALDRILRSPRTNKIEEIMDVALHPVDANLDQEAAARILQQYNLLSAAVVDEAQRLVGVLTIDDVLDVIQQEAEEDIKRMGGVGDEELSDKVFDIFKSRFVWLLLNLGTAILASMVIGLFDATISQMVALAILLPVVASMGGNAATQTMTISVRALATKDLDSYNARRIITRELIVGALNGVLFALIIGIVAWVWFGNGVLGIVIAVAMIMNMVFAALAGILIPIALDKLDIDPAVASSVFVTTVTDIIGFFAFLGLAALFLV